MFRVSIVTFAIEMATFFVTYVAGETKQLTTSGSYAVLAIVGTCTCVALVALIANIRNLINTYWQRGRSITGIVFAGITLFFSFIFFVAFIFGYMAASKTGF